MTKINESSNREAQIGERQNEPLCDPAVLGRLGSF